MARHLVCITFDFDAMSGFIARGMTSPTPISRGEFGADVATARILELLKKYKIPTSWYIPGHTLETYPERCKQVFDAGHEVGHHGWTHRPPATLTRDEEEAELVRANEAIRRLSGRNARGYRSPSWDLSPHSVEILLKHGDVREVSVIGRPDREWGEVVVAYVVGDAPSAELDALCLNSIARFKRPKDYVFVEALPKNNYGKILKTELRMMDGRRNSPRAPG